MRFQHGQRVHHDDVGNPRGEHRVSNIDRLLARLRLRKHDCVVDTKEMLRPRLVPSTLNINPPDDALAILPTRATRLRLLVIRGPDRECRCPAVSTHPLRAAGGTQERRRLGR